MRVQRSGSFVLAFPPDVVRPLFTALGERDWAPGWDPVWASDPEVHEVGEVWTTSGTTWVTVDASPLRASYARVAQDDSAGLVTVTLVAQGSATRVTVDYDLSSLSDAGAERLAAFEAEYDEMLRHWQQYTSQVLSDH